MKKVNVAKWKYPQNGKMGMQFTVHLREFKVRKELPFRPVANIVKGYLYDFLQHA